MVSSTIERPKCHQRSDNLKKALARAGFNQRPGKGSHTKWIHSIFPYVFVNLSGKDGNDAKQYQIEDVQEALREVGENDEL
jgi:predicted RNA binding protein YcfA (HicA-like mRNA interferase family)